MVLSSICVLVNIIHLVDSFSVTNKLLQQRTLVAESSSATQPSSIISLGLMSEGEKDVGMWKKEKGNVGKKVIGIVATMVLGWNVASYNAVAFDPIESSLASSHIIVSADQSNLADFSLPSYEETVRAATNTNLKGTKDLLGDKGVKFAE